MVLLAKVNRSHALFLKRILSVAGALLFSLSSYAEKADQNKPLLFDAAQASYDDLKQIHTFSGRVVITKGTMVLKSEFAQVRIDPEGNEYVTATAAPGQVVFLRQKTDNPNELMEGYGERVEYDVKSDMVRFIGKARLKRFLGKTLMDDIQGKIITRDGLRAVYQAQGQPDAVAGEDQRVHITITPRGDKPHSTK